MKLHCAFRFCFGVKTMATGGRDLPPNGGRGARSREVRILRKKTQDVKIPFKENEIAQLKAETRKLKQQRKTLTELFDKLETEKQSK